MNRLATVITVSDRSSRGEREDTAGPVAVAGLTAAGFTVESPTIIPDGAANVTNAIRAALDAGAQVVITSGGTGVTPSDQTPEGTAPLIAQELPGVAEALRRHGTQFTPHAAISRGLVGVSSAPRAIIANLPGSSKAVAQGMDVLVPLLSHLVDQLAGGDH